METYEFEGKTTEDAIQNACAALNVNRDDMEIQITEPGSAGIFGIMGGRKAKILVSLKKEPETEDFFADDQTLTAAKEALEEILKLIPIEGAVVSAERTDGTLALVIEGDTTGILIGRKGRTLDALQFIVNKIVNKNSDKKIQVVIDSENYRERRRDFLIQMALELGDKAKKTRKSVTTNLLNPHDRRIVHLALKEDAELDTKSRGEGLLKRVIILPKRKGNEKASVLH